MPSLFRLRAGPIRRRIKAEVASNLFGLVARYRIDAEGDGQLQKALDLFPQARGSAASMQSFVALSAASLIAGVFVPMVQASLLQLALLSALSVWLGVVLWRFEIWLSRPVG